MGVIGGLIVKIIDGAVITLKKYFTYGLSVKKM